MLFDLRGRGRRRTVQVIYLGLALIFLLGFVGFGVGVGGSGGGLFNAFTEGGGSNSASFAGRVASAEKRTKREPSSAAAWAALVEAQLHEASEGTYFDSATEQYTSEGKKLLGKVARAWSTYLTLEPHNPSVPLAKRMTSLVFSESGLNQPSQALQAWQYVIAAEPASSSLYGILAEYAYRAHNTGVGDLAAKKAENLAPAGERKRIKTELEYIKQNPNGASSSSSGTSSVPSGSITTTVNGKKTVLKSTGNGKLTGTSTGSAAHGTSSSTTK
ncbi:MAG TPA: hypothetical protein VMS02_06215 [Solirubrobacteraceae bacterium]|nr:hypothetical protein [Solirubrobacteraceae bacterium]